MSIIMNDIKNYIDFLRNSGFEVSLAVCGDNAIYGDDLPDLYNYSVHNNSVCSYMKSNVKTGGRCVAAKDRLRKNPPCGACSSVCYAGVCDFIFPAKSGGKTVALAIVTGYRVQNEQTKRCVDAISALCGGEYISRFGELNSNLPDYSALSAAVTPLLYMLARLYEYARDNAVNCPHEPWYQKSLQYIFDNYMNDIDSAAVARYVGYSESYLRRLFREKCGVTIGAFINDVRLQKAAQQLKTTDYSISYIAELCGYSDPNYFSYAFGKKYGTSPKSYRKKYRFSP